MKKISIKTAIRKPEIIQALNGLIGCPEGGWGETRQAILRLIDELPRRENRSWTANDLINYSLELNFADRYRWKEGI